MHTLRRLLSLVVLLPSAAAHAATYIVPSDEALIGRAHAVVIARALTSYAEDSKERGIETVTVLSIEEVLKGELSRGDEIKVRTIGGALEKKIKVVPGAPRFTDGERALVFLNEFDGHYVVTDFALGHFKFQTDDTGREVVIRDATEIRGWNTDGTVHREARRDAALFLRYVRGIARHLPARSGYTVEPRPLVGDTPRKARGILPVIPNACSPCTATQYTMSGDTLETDNGMRWAVFPAAANYNKGNSASNAANGGTDAINAAFANWNNDAMSNTNLVLATFNANLNGITDAADGVTNVVFEEDLPGNDFSCAGGGLLGLGGIQSTSGTSMVGSETFFSIFEADASMNKGVNACIGGALPVANFIAAITHEVGHTIGFRHSDQTRLPSAPAACTTQPTYDCSNDAIMTASVTYGPLKTWDQSAVRAVYPGSAPPAAPTGVVATATSTTTVSVTWTTNGSPSYRVYRSSGSGVFAMLSGTPAAPPYIDSTAAAGTAYMYRVTAFNGAESLPSNADLATTVIFTDTSLPGVIVKAVHVTELRTAINAVRTLAGLGGGSFAEAITAQSTTVKASHVTEMRSALNAARTDPDINLTAVSFSRSTLTPTVTTIAAVDITELRGGVQ